MIRMGAKMGIEEQRELQALRVFKKVELFEYVMAVAQAISQEKALKILEDCTVNSALKWFEENKDKLEFKGSLIDQAFEIFYLKHLGLDPKDVKIVEKAENRLVCRWRNFCSVLEACKLLGLDTRIICRKVYEKPGKALLKRINSLLKFSRNYDKIRPYADYCEEIIELGSDWPSHSPLCDKLGQVMNI